MVQIGYRCERCLEWYPSKELAEKCQQNCYDYPLQLIKEKLSCGCIKAYEWEDDINSGIQNRLKTNQFECKPCKSHRDFWTSEWTYNIPQQDRQTGIKVGANIRLIISKNILTNKEQVIGVFGSYMEFVRLGNFVGTINIEEAKKTVKFLNKWIANEKIG